MDEVNSKVSEIEEENRLMGESRRELESRLVSIAENDKTSANENIQNEILKQKDEEFARLEQKLSMAKEELQKLPGLTE